MSYSVNAVILCALSLNRVGNSVQFLYKCHVAHFGPKRMKNQEIIKKEIKKK